LHIVANLFVVAETLQWPFSLVYMPQKCR